ncbi:MAG: PD-(D/E)XK nuclease family protein [Pseudomonadota bacterium]|nr:PD-(D/E)XK nuclease family protein [Pseudomonadota bacterium]
MLLSPILIAPSARFWDRAAAGLLQQAQAGAVALSEWRVLVPTFEHARLLKLALAAQLGGAFVPPTISTLSYWVGLQLPKGEAPAGESERLMRLYAELRQHGWLKKHFSARRNTDLLPLAQTLLGLADELTASLLPALQAQPDVATARWQLALEQLAPPARQLLSEESQLVWTIWKTQLDERDAQVQRWAQLQALAQRIETPLVWISPVAPEPIEAAFLQACAARVAVQSIGLDWRTGATSPQLAAAWPELTDPIDAPQGDATAPAALGLQHATLEARISHSPATSLEDEAVRAARCVLDWIASGTERIAVVAQDRVVARRLRALLERAQVYVVDETGWKLSTTRAAAALAALLEVITSRAATPALLDFLKSPFVSGERPGAAQQVLAIELALRRANVSGGWEAVAQALEALPAERRWFAQLREQAATLQRQRSVTQWVSATLSVLDQLAMHSALRSDAAGMQLLDRLGAIEQDCVGLGPMFSFAEWRALLNLQLEAAPFVAPQRDRRVVMLPLNGARLRHFDAVLMVGCDAAHLPSQPPETLFFANAVRRELGLATRESRQRQQLRDFAELLHGSGKLVLSWQAHRDDEPNPVSPWIARLDLALARQGLPALPLQHHPATLALCTPCLPSMPAPRAPQLRPSRLSASAYNTLVACPYQFFASYMLGLRALDEIAELPEKRDYGGWLHRILADYHVAVGTRATPDDQRAELLASLSEQVFRQELARNGAALGYYVRWQKTMPAYLEWTRQREAAGWRFVASEVKRERKLVWSDGEILLHGRLDRIDRHDDGDHAVLDYKTSPHATLASRLKQAEDHQLAFYGLLSDPTPAAAHYVALEPKDDKTGDVAAPDYGLWRDALERQIATQMQAIDHRAGLPANAPESVCTYCEMRGLCRKGAW